MIYEYCRYDARKSRESVNIKIHLSLDEFFLLSYTCESATYKYHMINTGTSCYNFSSRIKKKTIGACIHRYVSFKSSEFLGVTLAPRRKQQRLIISYISVLILRV